MAKQKKVVDEPELQPEQMLESARSGIDSLHWYRALDAWLTKGGRLPRDWCGPWASKPAPTLEEAEVKPAAPEEDVTYYCKCSWLGGDPDVSPKGRHTCPACWAKDRKRVSVYPKAKYPWQTKEWRVGRKKPE